MCWHACFVVYGFASLVKLVSFSELFAFLVSLHIFSSVFGFVGSFVSMCGAFIFSLYYVLVH